MNQKTTILLRALALVGIVAVIKFAFSDRVETFGGFVDLKAAVLVFLSPVLILMLFHRETMSWLEAFRRLNETRLLTNAQLYEDLLRSSEPALGVYGASSILKMGEGHPDRFVRYASEIFSSRFKPEEIAGLFARQIEAEDIYWQSFVNVFGFLAKMAPYFGMLATVIGMVKLLENLHDFTKISGGMALAMQGTLYGLVSFTMVYSPLQKFLSGTRDLIYRRNEMVARWFVLVTEKADLAFLRQELKSQRFSSPVPTQRAKAPLATTPAFPRGGK